MPTRPPPERRTNGATRTPSAPLWLVVSILMAVLFAAQLAITQKRKDAREQRYWSDLSLIYDAGRLGMCEGSVDPAIAETCAKLKGSR